MLNVNIAFRIDFLNSSCAAGRPDDDAGGAMIANAAPPVIPMANASKCNRGYITGTL